jgi:Secretion system C-terminal sorting domain
MKRIFLIGLWSLLFVKANAQLENLFVECYYVADSMDVTDTAGGHLLLGETTYRVFLDLAPGSKLLSLFGDTDHPFSISSTRRFFNNTDGATFGYEIPKVSYESNTVALDTYITLGQTGFQGLRNFYGLPKSQDDDGSFIGGINNDGGSEMVDGGLLVNETSLCGLPLTEADGMDTLELELTQWSSFGVVDFSSGIDSTLFGTVVVDSVFQRSNFVLQCEGVFGVIPDSNYVLIAQLTTPGEIALQLNASVITATGDTLNYVSTNELTSPAEFFAPFLNYPQVCGCTDPDYLEFGPDYACSEDGSCNTLIVLGCMDSIACNFNPLANVQTPSLCCYPGFCDERDLEVVCPQLKGNSFDFEVYPNPAATYASVQVLSGVVSNVKIDILNYNGVVMYTESVFEAPLNYTRQVDMTDWPQGIYQVRVEGINGVQSSMLVKL